MTREHAAKIKVGDRLVWKPMAPDSVRGTVIEVGYCAIKTKWDDGQIGLTHLDDMALISRQVVKKIR